MDTLNRFFARHTMLCIAIGSLIGGPILLILIGSIGYEPDPDPVQMAPAPIPVAPGPAAQPQIDAKEFLPEPYEVPDNFGVPIPQNRHDTVIFVVPDEKSLEDETP